MSHHTHPSAKNGAWPRGYQSSSLRVPGRRTPWLSLSLAHQLLRASEALRLSRTADRREPRSAPHSKYHPIYVYTPYSGLSDGDFRNPASHTPSCLMPWGGRGPLSQYSTPYANSKARMFQMSQPMESPSPSHKVSLEVLPLYSDTRQT